MLATWWLYLLLVLLSAALLILPWLIRTFRQRRERSNSRACYLRGTHLPPVGVANEVPLSRPDWVCQTRGRPAINSAVGVMTPPFAGLSMVISKSY
jgi:hypothetical protein